MDEQRVILAERIAEGPSQELNLRILANVKSKKVFGSGAKMRITVVLEQKQKGILFQKRLKGTKKNVLHLDGTSS